VRMVHIMGMRRNWEKFTLDLGSAFFTSNKTTKTHLWVREPPELLRPDGISRYRQLWVEVPGTKSAPRAFYETLIEYLVEEHGCVRSREDRCLIYHPDHNGEQEMAACFHVDDGVGYGTTEAVDWFEACLAERFVVKFKRVPRGVMSEFAGVEWAEFDDYVETSQHAYINTKLQEIPISKQRQKQVTRYITDDERSAMRSVLGGIRWVHKTIADIGYDLNRLATWVSMEDCTVEQLNRTNKVVRYLKRGRRPHEHDGDQTNGQMGMTRIPRFGPEPLKVTFVVDAAEPTDDALYRGKWHGCKAIGLQHDDWMADTKFGLLYFSSSLTRRVSNSSLDGETNAYMEGLDIALSCALLVEEFEYGVRASLWENKIHGLIPDEPLALRTPIEGHTDSDDLVKASRSLVFSKSLAKRRKADVCDIQELQDLGVLREMVKIAGKTNPTNAGTKKLSFEDPTMYRLRELQQGWYEVDQ
jgi:hypothetical protein